MNKIITLLICITLTSCSSIYYVPNTQNVPIIREKGQTNLSFDLNISESTDGFEFQGAYGLTDKIALQLNFDKVKSSEGTTDGSGKFVEFGPGYYKNLSEHFLFESYGLLGFGSFRDEESYYDSQANATITRKINGNLFRIGLQPSISYVRKYFIASFSGRFSNLNYSSIDGNSYAVDNLKANNSFWLIEPALTLQGGLENVKLFLQFQGSLNMTDPHFDQDVTLVSLGLKVNINPKKELK
jgi:hypothetical protein